LHKSVAAGALISAAYSMSKVGRFFQPAHVGTVYTVGLYENGCGILRQGYCKYSYCLSFSRWRHL